uniref:Uncharacterized protein n=1 Tax=Heterorhabditis bacteriophora TaxID=37862 RepID=A0A1I7WB18_HETBA
MNRRFRVSLRRLLGWRFLASDEEFNAFTSSTRTNSQCPSRITKECNYPLINFKYDSIKFIHEGDT